MRSETDTVLKCFLLDSCSLGGMKEEEEEPRHDKSPFTTSRLCKPLRLRAFNTTRQHRRCRRLCWRRPRYTSRKRGRRCARRSEYDIAAIVVAVPQRPGVSGRQLRRRSGRWGFREAAAAPQRYRRLPTSTPLRRSSVSGPGPQRRRRRRQGSRPPALPFSCLGSNTIGIIEIKRNNQERQKE